MDNLKTAELVTTNDYGDELETPFFRLTYKDDVTAIVPCEPTNRYYQDFAEWYDKQKKKPFKYDFKKNKPE